MIDLPLTAMITALGLGFFGSAHCIAMCGGICSALSFALPAGRPGLRLLILLGYNLGRVSSYVLMAVLLSALSLWVAQSLGADFTRSYLSGLRVLAGVLLIMMGLYLANWWRGLSYLEQAGQSLWRKVAPVAQKLTPVQSLPKAILFGAIWGWLPCGLVYSALALAITQSSVTGSALTMAAFGVGTLPALLVTGLLADRLRALLNSKRLRTVFALLLMAFGLWTLKYAFGHGGHNHADMPTDNSDNMSGHHHHSMNH